MLWATFLSQNVYIYLQSLWRNAPESRPNIYLSQIRIKPSLFVHMPIWYVPC